MEILNTVFRKPVQVRTDILLENEIVFKCKEKENLVNLVEKTTFPSTLIELSQHEFWIVRKRVAGNVHTPVVAFKTLVYDPDYLVRLALVSNPNIDKRSLELLSKDENYFVSQAAKGKLK